MKKNEKYEEHIKENRFSSQAWDNTSLILKGKEDSTPSLNNDEKLKKGEEHEDEKEEKKEEKKEDDKEDN